MRKIVCESYTKEKVTFTYEFPFFLEDVEGLHEVVGNVIGIKNAFAVGENYVGTSVEKRNIVISGIIKDDFVNNRQKLYRIFPLNTTGTLYYYEDDLERKINYKVESIKINDKGYPKVFQISLICHSPYFMDLVETIAKIQNWDSLLEFPVEISSQGIEFGAKNNNTMVTISNPSNISLGMTITFTCTGDVENPILINASTQEKMKINHSLHSGESIVVTTHINNKTITFIDSQGNKTNIINCLVFGTKFLQVSKGENKFKPSADSGVEYLQTQISYSNYYEAV